MTEVIGLIIIFVLALALLFTTYKLIKNTVWLCKYRKAKTHEEKMKVCMKETWYN